MAPKTTPFQEKHALEFGLKLIKTKRVARNLCDACSASMTGVTRLRLEAQLLAINYRSHNTTQHGKAWAEYSELCNAEKREYFTGKTKIVNTLHHYFDVEGYTMEFEDSPPIVETIIGDMFFKNDEMLDNAEDNDEDNLVASDAAKADSETEKYVVTMKNVMRNELALDHVGSGISSRQAAMEIEHAKRRTQTPKPAGINRLMIGEFIRALVASNLQRITDFMGDASVWAFSFACDGSTHRGQLFFDMRLRFCYRGVQVNLHLVAIPMFDRHTSQIIFDTVCKFMDALSAFYESWRGKMLCVASDGENAMTGHHAGLVTRLCAANEHPVLRIWCAPHQIDLEMSTRPPCVPRRMGRQSARVQRLPECSEQLDHRDECQDPEADYSLGPVWHRADLFHQIPSKAVLLRGWSSEARPAVAVLVDHDNKALLMAQQDKHIVNFIGALVAMFNIDSTDGPVDGYFVNGGMRITYVDIVAHIEDQGSWPTQLLAALSDDEKLDVLREVATYAMKLVLGLQSV
uniref:Uncharacterized protein n=1 Tax=Hyaloperonospora arabidopsidis (strain Emoy2) TaxID=559515 RepID=M4BUL5_HYAAE